MNSMESFIASLAEKAREQQIINDNDYIGADGLLYCGKCNKKKQCYIENFSTAHGKRGKVVPVVCDCEKAEEEKIKNALRTQHINDRILQLQKKGIVQRRYEISTFEHDDNNKAEISKLCLDYVKNWDENRQENNGILFYGGTGTGKSFYSYCIANYLLKEHCVPVLVTNLSRLVKDRTSNNAEAVSLEDFELFVIDDYGVEKATPTAYNIINDLYLSNKPLIITTNLTPSQIKNTSGAVDIERRINDRIIEMCKITVCTGNQSLRYKIAHPDT